MANPEHLAILKQGVEMWNEWRQEHPDIWPDLNKADLSDSRLRRADLSDADLADADLADADLSFADFGGANLNGADLSRADLSLTNFSLADLRAAHLFNANLTGAILTRADLSDAYLLGANLRQAKIGLTSFGDRDLREIKGLETILHIARSPLSINTIYLSEGDIPEAFLKGAGVPDTFITYMRSLIVQPLDYNTCFISYSSRDDDFAHRLHADLQSKGVRCWFAPEDLKIGEKFWHRIDESIRLYDKLLVVLTEHSVQSDWVEREVMAALEKEKRGKLVLFPITLDDAVKNSSAPWVADLRRQRHIGDFRNWKNHDEYQKAFNRLLRDLNAVS